MSIISSWNQNDSGVDDFALQLPGWNPPQTPLSLTSQKNPFVSQTDWVAKVIIDTKGALKNSSTTVTFDCIVDDKMQTIG